jgi:hypothetical protein
MRDLTLSPSGTRQTEQVHLIIVLLWGQLMPMLIAYQLLLSAVAVLQHVMARTSSLNFLLLE